MRARACGEWCLVLLAGLVGVGWGEAQQTAAPVTTLHVYASQIEVAVLVLSGSKERLPPIEAKDFSLRFDQGPGFRPNHVRREGEDPIVLGLLVVGNGGEGELLAAVSAATASLAPESLHAQDRVVVYGWGCRLNRTLAPVPVETESLRSAVEGAVPKQAAAKSGGCKDPVQLWDAMAVAVHDLSRYGGRRVLLAVTNGDDHGSATGWAKLRVFAEDQSVAIFAMTGPDVQLPGAVVGEEDLSMLCEGSGGLVMRSSGRRMGIAMGRLVSMLRESYIVSFPRPHGLPAGHIDLDISVHRVGAFVRPTGTSVPLEDAGVAGAADTIASDPSKEPVVGRRRAVKPPVPPQ
ncbi:MAG TPA: hypothetical protein VGD62_02400 [Acidobacteriaceae bacterium]